MTTLESILLPKATCEGLTSGVLDWITSPERDTYTAGTEYKLCSSLELIETPLGWKWVRRRAYGRIRLGEPVEIRYGLRSILDPPTGRWFCVMQHPMIDGRTYLVMQSCDGFGMTTSPSDQDQHGVPFTPGHWAWPVEVLS